MEREDNGAMARAPGSTFGSGRSLEGRGGGGGSSELPALERPTTADSYASSSRDPELEQPPSAARSLQSPAAGESKIPRPRATTATATTTSSSGGARPRRPISLTDAYRMAEEEERRRARVSPPAGADASPSPAPRPWLSRHTTDEQRMQAILDRSPPSPKGSRRGLRGLAAGDAAGRRTAPPEHRRDDTVSSVESLGSEFGTASEAGSQQSDGRDSDIDRKLREFERDLAREGAMRGNRNGGLFSNSAKLGPKVAEAGEALSRKTSNSSLDKEPPTQQPQQQPAQRRTWGSKAKKNSGWLARMMSAPERIESGEAETWEQVGEAAGNAPVERGEAGPTPPSSRPVSARPENPSPSKSFRWQVDDDFTAGDLQISGSPPVKPRNTKLDDIRARELELAGQSFTDAEPEPDTELPPSPPLRSKNTKLDDIRAREMASLSKKAIASRVLGDIREINAESSRSLSPDVLSRDRSGESTPGRRASRDRPILDDGEHIPNTPITVFRNSNHDRLDTPGDNSANGKTPASTGSTRSSSVHSHSREDSRDLLRRLARVTTSLSPAPESAPAPPANQVAPDPKRGDEKLAAGNNKNKTTSDKTEVRGKKSFGSKPAGPSSSKLSVESAGVRRVRSTDSAREKRQSMVSDNDPSERIEGELKLFEPLEGSERGSDKGSIRGSSSPEPPADDEDDTKTQEDFEPAAGKLDADQLDVVAPTPAPKSEPLVAPTPRVIGAYVDTPATIKVEKKEGLPSTTAKETRSDSLRSDSLSSRGRRSDSSLPKSAASSKTRIPVPKSRSRHRTPPALINTAKPPTVKGDLLEIQRSNHIEDSTDDLADLLDMDKLEDLDASQLEHILQIQSSTSEQPLAESPRPRQKDESPHREPKPEAPVKPAKEMSDRERELEDELQTMGKMSKRLTTSLLGIRTAKQGIERLEGQVTSDKKAAAAAAAAAVAKGHHHHAATCPQCGTDVDVPLVPAAAASFSYHYAHIPLVVPRLYQRQPSFRPTLLGTLALTLALYLVLETYLCTLFCRPTPAFCAWASLLTGPPTLDPATGRATPPCAFLRPASLFDSPAWGHALPTKLDDWLLAGAGRRAAARAAAGLDDALADAWDAVTGADIEKVDLRRLDYWARAKLARRLRKRRRRAAALAVGGAGADPGEADATTPGGAAAAYGDWRQRVERDAAPEVRARFAAYRETALQLKKEGGGARRGGTEKLPPQDEGGKGWWGRLFGGGDAANEGRMGRDDEGAARARAESMDEDEAL